ncbi:MAG TPA: hypothetical protein VH353_11030 [Caulobacteraceae bacterium]|jgi:hypothetical protein|nr:hypothetical protein [Caulobacteraceae bacterium]
MSEDRRRILAMLAEGKITTEEAERLLSALDRPTPQAIPDSASPRRYLRVEVDAHDDGRNSPTRVNIRVPMNFLRAGVRLASVIPPAARDKVNAAMARNGIPFDVEHIKPETLEALVEQLGEFLIDVDEKDAKVRIYCE